MTAIQLARMLFALPDEVKDLPVAIEEDDLWMDIENLVVYLEGEKRVILTGVLPEHKGNVHFR